MNMRITRALIAGGMIIATAAASEAATVTFTLTGLFDINLAGNDFNAIPLTLQGIGTPISLTTPGGDPVILFSKLDAIVPNYGTFAVPANIAFYFHPGGGPTTGEGGFIDFVTGQKVLILHSPAFTGYDGTTDLTDTDLDFGSADGFTTPFGTARVITASTLRLTTSSAAVPEPAAWALFVGGFGLIGAASRRRPRVSVALG